MKKLLLHACCGPCLAGTYDQVIDRFEPTIFWFNPNIEPKSEHDKRLDTLYEYLSKIAPDIKIIQKYDYVIENKSWHEAVRGLENEPEGGERCKKCFAFRLERAAQIAKEKDIPFMTTLTISPHKDTLAINQIGLAIAETVGADFQAEDLKKDNGYRKSIENSKKLGLYRQKYCGCQYSFND